MFVFQETVSEGPVPLCSANSVSFVAEQVSHHPPSKYWLILGWSVVEAFTLVLNSPSVSIRMKSLTVFLNVAALPEMCVFPVSCLQFLHSMQSV